MNKLVLLLLIFQFSIAFCQNDELYLEGTLGKSKIYMQLYVFGSPTEEPNTTAKYFYQNSLKDILLKGTKKNNVYTLVFKHEDTIHEKFVITKINDTNFEGTWCNSKGKSFPIKLYPIDFSIYKSTLPEDFFRYEKLNLVKFKFLEFKKQKTSIYKNNEIVWYIEKHCDAPFFRLGNTFSEKSNNAVNPVLKNIQIQNALWQLECSSDYYYNTGANVYFDTELTFLNNNLIGFKTSSDWYCGGAYPDSGTTGYLIDLNSGKNYEIDDIIAFDKSVTTEKESDFGSWVKYRQEYFAPKLFAIINSEQNFVKPRDTDEQGCDLTNLDWWWATETWVYTEEGIEFTPSFPHAGRACQETYLLPFEKLKKYKNPKFNYSLR